MTMIVGETLKHRNIKSFSLNQKTLGKILRILINENKKTQYEEFKNFRKNKNYDNISDDDLTKQEELFTF